MNLRRSLSRSVSPSRAGGRSSKRKDSVDCLPPPEDPQSAKTRIAERLTKKVDSVVPTKNRSPDLIPLAAEYEQFKKNLRTLVSSVKHYAECTERMVASRDEVRERSLDPHKLCF